MAKRKAQNLSPRIANRRASFDYHISDKFEVGVELRGTEVKSVREGQVSLAEGYIAVDPRTNVLMLHNVEISRYQHGGPLQHEPKRPRRLLAHRREIEKLAGATSDKGTTIVPLAMYFKQGRIKLEIGLGVGKKHYDKRDDLRARDAKREMQQGMTRKQL